MRRKFKRSISKHHVHTLSRDTAARKARRPFYQSKQWRDLRKRLKAKAIAEQIKLYGAANHEAMKVLMGGDPLCQRCLALGKYHAAKVLDHIVPIAEGGARLDENNLQWLCESAHNRKSALEGIKNRGGGGQNNVA